MIYDPPPTERSAPRVFSFGPLGPLGAVSFPVALVLASWIGASTWKSVKTKPETHSIHVTGSATKRIVSDLIEWQTSVETQDLERGAAYRQLAAHVAKTSAFLQSHGVPAADMSVSSVSVEPMWETEVSGVGEERVERTVQRGFRLRQWITVRSQEVTTVAKVASDVTELLESGITVYSGTPTYHYTKLGDLKVEMLAEAAKDARTRAENIIGAAGGELGDLVGADMGIININPPNSRASSWDGNNDTSTVEKDIITVVHATFLLAE